MEVTELTAEAFWKGETEIRGTVMDGEDEYRVRILRKGSQNFDYSCSHISKTGRNLGFCGVSCTQGPDGIPMCLVKPQNKEEMLKVSGVGEFKFEKYGERFLDKIRDSLSGEL